MCIKNVYILRKFPNKVDLEIKGREAVAILASLRSQEASSSSFMENIATPSARDINNSYLVDSEGIIFSKGEGLNIPKIYTYNSNISLGELPDNYSINNSLKILSKVKLFKVEVKDALIGDNFFVVIAQPKIVFRINDNIDTQLASLQLILEKAKIDNKELEFIDLRFDKPVVKFAPKKN